VITFKTYKKPTVQVPPVIGLSYADAAKAVTDRGLKPVRKDVASDMPQGQVVDTDPKPSTRVAQHVTVTLYVSNGKSKVPNEVGKKVQDAKSDLSNKGWTNVQTQTQDTTDPAQDTIVLDQYPTAGSDFPKDQQITLTVWIYVPPTTPTTPTTPPTTPTTTPPTTPTTTPPTTPTTTPPTTPTTPTATPISRIFSTLLRSISLSS
jgi:eukaryotic-like serine/threonine-protein kinase